MDEGIAVPLILFYPPFDKLWGPFLWPMEFYTT